MPKRKMKFENLEQDYQNLVDEMKIKKSWVKGFQNVAQKIKANEERYRQISELASDGTIPWQFIGCIHNLECGLSFSKHLHNGNSLKRRTHWVPKGRPRKGTPPFTFNESAVDALRLKGYHRIPKNEWSLSRMAFELERNNGFGYRWYHPTVLTPYLWSGTTHYKRGKYVADRKWSSSAVSKQAGAMPVLKLTWDKPSGTLAKKSRKWFAINRVNDLLKGLLGALASLLTISNIETGIEWIAQLREYLPLSTILAMIAGGAIFWAFNAYLKSKQKEDFEKGNYIPSSMVEEDEEEDHRSGETS